MLPLFVIIDIAIAMKYEITVAIDVYLIKLFLNKENSIGVFEYHGKKEKMILLLR